MVTSDFRPEVKIRPFRACAMKNTQYNPYLWPNCRNFHVFQEIGAEELDGDVRYFTGNGNMAGSRMRNASGHNYWNSLFSMDVAMGQIPRSTERISSFLNFQGLESPGIYLWFNLTNMPSMYRTPCVNKCMKYSCYLLTEQFLCSL